MIIMGPIGTLFLFCQLGEHLTQCFCDMGEEFYLVSWYMFPLNTQKSWPFVIALGQNEVNLQGFGNAICNRELFKKVN